MDYDRTDIPARYDLGRDHGQGMLDLWMNALATHLDEHAPVRLLDLGCGTGRFADALSVRFNAEVIGVDPSKKMLEQARRKHHAGQVRYLLAPAEALPLRSATIDLIFMSMSFHHFVDQRSAAEECRRVLRAGGRVFVRSGTREQIPAYPYYRFFPSSHPIMEEVLPDRDTVHAVFKDAGFHSATHEIICQTVAPSWDAYAIKLATGADSVLARLLPLDFETGLAALRLHAAAAEAHDIVEPIDLFVFR